MQTTNDKNRQVSDKMQTTDVDLLAGLSLPDSDEESDTGIVPVSGSEIIDVVSDTLATRIVPEICEPQEEFESIYEEFVLGSTVRERAYYRIWRLKTSGNWQNVIGFEGAKYESWDLFVRNVADVIGVGRQSIYDRMRLYDQLDWLGYQHAQIIGKLSTAPNLYQKVLGRLVDWDAASKTPNAIMLPSADDLSLDDARKQLRSLIEDTEKYPRQIDAVRYIDENILLTPRVTWYMRDDSLVVDYVRTSVDSNGTVRVDESDTITFYPDRSIPDWVLGTLQGAIKSK